MNELVREYISVHDTISITTGAIYDYNNNGLWEGIVNETRYLLYIIRSYILKAYILICSFK